MLEEYSLAGKVAIVTGGGRGLGQAIALTLADAGADIVAAARTQQQLEETVALVKEKKRRAIGVPTDTTKGDQVEALVQKAIAEFGHIDILVNAAGVHMVKGILPMPEFPVYKPERFARWHFDQPTSEEQWDWIFGTNVKSVFLCCRAAGAYMMKQKKGKIVSIASGAPGQAMPYQVPYRSSKAAVDAFTRSLALEWARYKINVNAIGPGYFPSDISEWNVADDKLKEQTLRSIPLRRFPEPREVGLLAVYLASSASDHITGQTITIDGGTSLV